MSRRDEPANCPSPVTGVRRYRGRRLACAIAVLVAASSLRPSIANAHAVFSGSDPSDGESLAAAPAEVNLRFDEAVALTAAKVELRDGKGVVIASNVPAGADIATLGLSFAAPSAATTASTTDTDTTTSASTTATAVSPRTTASASTGTTLHISVPGLANDVYQLRWRLVSADDYHATVGALAFGVGQPVVAGGRTNEESFPSAATVAAGWIDLAAMALLIGALAIWQLVVPAALASLRRPDTVPLADHVTMRLVRLARSAATATIATKAVLLAVTTWTVTRSAGTITVLHALARQARRPSFVLAVIGATAIVVLLRPEGRRRRLAQATRALWCDGLAVALLGLSAQESHLATVRSGARLATVILTFHLLGAAVWVGGVAALMVVVWFVRRPGLHASGIERPLLCAFGPTATASVALLAVTGLYLTGRQVASVDAIVRSLYGHVLDVKLGLAFLAGVVGLVTHRKVRRRAEGFPAPRVLIIEVAIGMILLASAAALVSSPPARGARYVAAATARVVSSVSGTAADLFITTSVSPNQPGRAFVSINVTDTRRPTLGAPTEVDLTWLDAGNAPPRTYAATHVDGTRWQVPGVAIAAPGEAGMTVRVARAGRPDAQFAHAWVVPALPVAVPTTFLSRRPLAPILNVVVLVAITVAGLYLVARRRARTRIVTGLPIPRPADPQVEPLDVPREHLLVSASSED